MVPKKVSLYIFTSVILLFSSATQILAQEQSNFDVTISPTFVESSSKPGTIVNQTVRLRNNTNTQIQVVPEVKIMGGDEAGELTIKETKEAHLTWLTVKTDPITLRPNEWSTVPFSITIPDSASYGYYWALSFTSNNTSKDQITGTTLNASIVVPVLLTVNKPGAITEGKLLDFKTDSSTYEYPPVEFVTQFQNTGNVHIRPQGNIFIKDFFGRSVATLNVNESQGSILPTLKRSFTTVWNDGFVTYEPKMKDGEQVIGNNGKPEREMKIHFQKLLDLRIGKYTATALLLVSGQDKDYTYEKSISFFVFPWKIVLVLIGIIIFVGIGLFTTSRSVARKVSGIFGRSR